jgi:hypothetical protein
LNEEGIKRHGRSDPVVILRILKQANNLTTKVLLFAWLL